MAEKIKNHKTYPDIIRTMCIFGVLYGHTGSSAMYMFTDSQVDAFGKVISLLLWPWVLSSPFLFFMLSGGMLLHKQESLKKLFTHRIVRYLIIILVFGLFQRLYSSLVSGTLSSFSLADSLKSIYSYGAITQYWFLYTYLGVLLMLPFLRMIAEKLTKETALYLCGLLLVFQCFFTIFERAFDLDRVNVSLEILGNAMLLPLLGFCVEKPLKEFFEARRNRMIVYILACLTLLVDAFYAYRTFNSSGTAVPLYTSTALIAFAEYIFFKNAFEAHSFKPATKKIFEICGGGVFLTYLLEPQLREGFKFIYDVLVKYIYWLPATIIWLVCAELVGILVAFVLHLIPGVKKFI